MEMAQTYMHTVTDDASIELNGVSAQNFFEVAQMLRETNVSSFLDQWGPAQVLQVYDPATHMNGVLVIDNTVLGPGLGGLRITPLVTPFEVFKTARSTTWACALADVNFGGAAAAIRSATVPTNTDELVRAFAQEVAPLVPDQYIAAPDLNITADAIAAFVDVIGDRSGGIGKPAQMGGIPFELGLMGFGCGVVTETIAAALEPVHVLPGPLSDLRVAVQGFGSTAKAILKYLLNAGASIVAISDQDQLCANAKGLEHERVEAMVNSGQLSGGRVAPLAQLVGTDCDLLITTDAHSCIDDETVRNCRAKCIMEGVNHPITPIAERYCADHGVFVIPELFNEVTMAIVADAEYHRKPSPLAFALVESKLRELTTELTECALATGLSLKRIAIERAQERVLNELEEEY